MTFCGKKKFTRSSWLPQMIIFVVLLRFQTIQNNLVNLEPNTVISFFNDCFLKIVNCGSFTFVPHFFLFCEQCTNIYKKQNSRKHIEEQRGFKENFESCFAPI